MKKNYRWIVFGVVCIISFLAFVDRVNLSVAAPLIAKEYNLSGEQMGLLFGAMLPAYAVVTFLAGFILDRYKPTAVISIGILLWSGATLGFAACTGFAAMYMYRLIFGTGEAMFQPFGTKIQSNWLLPTERGIANSFGVIATLLAIAFGAPLCGWILKTHSWQTLFYIFSSFGIIAITLVLLLVKAKPSEHKWCSEEERNRIEEALRKESIARKDDTQTSAGISTVLKNKNTWMFALLYFAICLTWWADMNWFPSFLVKSRGLTVSQSGWWTMGPYLVSTVGLLLGGLITDKILKGRRLPLIIAAMVIAVPLVFLAVGAKSNVVMIVLFSVSLMCNAAAVSQIWAALLGVVPREYVASTGGIVNFGGSVAGFLAPLVIGKVLDLTSSFYWGFGSLALATGIGAILFGIPILLNENRVFSRLQEDNASAA